MDAVHTALLNVVGESATIAVPTYTVDLTEEDIYDPDSTPANGMGSYSDFVLSLPGRCRSLCPIHNHAAVGTGAAGLAAATDGTCSIGPGSDFEKFYDDDYDLLLLGCGFAQGATYLHHLEAVENVPYRKWVDVERRRRCPEQSDRAMQIRYFARNEPDLIEDFDTIEQQLVDLGEVAKVAAPYGSSFRVPIRRLHALVVDALGKNPYLLVRPRENSAA